MTPQTVGPDSGVRYLIDYPYVFSTRTNTEIAVCVLIFAADGTKLTYTDEGPWEGPDGMMCRAFEISGIVFDGPATNYHYLTFSFTPDINESGVYVYVDYGDSDGDRRGTVSVADSIGSGNQHS